MHREAAGIATLVPMMNFEEMSHQMGAQLTAFPRQIMELMNWFRHARRVQIIKRHVAAFSAGRCHVSGMELRRNPRNAKHVKIWFGYAMYGGKGCNLDFVEQSPRVR